MFWGFGEEVPANDVPKMMAAKNVVTPYEECRFCLLRGLRGGMGLCRVGAWRMNFP